jgi:hypothetical protein
MRTHRNLAVDQRRGGCLQAKDCPGRAGQPVLVLRRLRHYGNAVRFEHRDVVREQLGPRVNA